MAFLSRVRLGSGMYIILAVLWLFYFTGPSKYWDKILNVGEIDNTASYSNNIFNQAHIPIITTLENLATAWESVPFLNTSLQPRRLNKTLHVKAIDTMARMSQFFLDHNITWIMGFGTLLGSYMSHNILPWDDDLDVVIYIKDIPKLQELHKEGLLRKEQDLGLYILDRHCRDINGTQRPEAIHRNIETCVNAKLKIYDGTYKSDQTYWFGEWNWPFVDIILFDYNTTHAWINNYPWKHVVPIDKFYPLQMRPFDRLLLPAPWSPRDVLSSLYKHTGYGGKGHFMCKSGSWDHITRKGIKAVKCECSNLVNFYPLVHRDKGGNSTVVEKLCIHGQCYYSMEIQQEFQKDWQPTPYELFW